MVRILGSDASGDKAERPKQPLVGTLLINRVSMWLDVRAASSWLSTEPPNACRGRRRPVVDCSGLGL